MATGAESAVSEGAKSRPRKRGLERAEVPRVDDDIAATGLFSGARDRVTFDEEGHGGRKGKWKVAGNRRGLHLRETRDLAEGIFEKRGLALRRSKILSATKRDGRR